ncbi:putative epoxide hydrolase [Sphingomonas changbaiensis NBRC 104936]|uniref:Putative epoxide hydrolase n=1 Tax=Sphingomonas changbaiensis NBRC 104936 TaxID=1219043 RepID=A0A0E9MLA6_9SPHN|nr:alpha/beta hydrolase [Sphingomonas changbaiensis]GAO38201.1 putative epoxide hydrolase [Sphingomonas changbaiensis NBRC 104936]
MEFVTVGNGDIDLNVAVAGEGPLILCVHGWPELWYSWRHQIAHFSGLGFKVAAMDVRGYGSSSKPHPIEAYTMRNLASDVAAVIDALGGGQAILFGHDWGAPIVWNTALMYPAKVRAVAGLSVPYAPRGQASFLKLAELIYAGRFFYQLYFQKEGVAEAELEADVRSALRRIYYSASGDFRDEQAGTFNAKGPDSTFLEGLPDPQPFPSWMSDADLDVFTDAFEKGGFRGPLNRYRAQNIDFDESADLAGKPIMQPACFIAGERDPVRNFVPGLDLYARAGDHCTDFRGTTLIPEVGHWVQQEAPKATNAALERFVSGL